MKNKGINIAVLLIIGLTLVLIWVLFIKGPDGEILDLSNLLRLLYDNNVHVFLFILGLVILFYKFSDFFLEIILVILSVLRILNTCDYCVTLRNENSPYLVNGSCGKCKTNLCKLCFKYINKEKNKSVGCPSCGCITFVPNNLLAYPFHIPRSFVKRLETIQEDRKKKRDVINV